MANQMLPRQITIEYPYEQRLEDIDAAIKSVDQLIETDPLDQMIIQQLAMDIYNRCNRIGIIITKWRSGNCVEWRTLSDIRNSLVNRRKAEVRVFGS